MTPRRVIVALGVVVALQSAAMLVLVLLPPRTVTVNRCWFDVPKITTQRV